MNRNFKIMIASGAVFFGILIGFSLSSRDTSNTDKAPAKEMPSSSGKKDMIPIKTEKAETKSVSPEPKAAVKWYSYTDGMAVGKEKKKKVFLSFYADWCGYCKQMDKTTFADKSVVSYMNENFVPIRVNADREINLTSTYNVRGLPATWFLSENGEEIGSQPGYIPPDTMLPLLKYIHSDNYKKMSFDKFMKGM